MASNVQKAMELSDLLTPDEKKLIYKRMNDDINGRLLGFLDTVNERTEKLPISMCEITRVVEEVRSANYEKIQMDTDT